MIANEWLKVADKMEYKEKDWLWKTENSNKKLAPSLCLFFTGYCLRLVALRKLGA